MGTTPKQMVAPQQLTNADALYYTVPAGTTGVIKRATFSNTTVGVVTVTANIVAAAGSSSAGNEIFGILPVPVRGNPAYVSSELAGKTMPAGTMIRMLASAGASVTVAIDGVETV